MKIRSVQNPLLPIVEHYDGNGRKIATTYYDELTGIGTTYDANGKKIGTSVENPVTLISDYYDAKGNRTASSFHNDIIGATQYYDRDYRPAATRWDNPITGVTVYEGDDLYAASKEGTPRSRSNARPVLTPVESKENTKTVNVQCSTISFQMGLEFAACMARSLVNAKIPFDGSIYDLSSEIKHTVYEDIERYTSVRSSDQLKDGFYLLQDKMEENKSSVRPGAKEKHHNLYVLRGDGELLSGKYTSVDDRFYHTKTPAKWCKLDASGFIVSLLENYVREKSGNKEYDFYGEFIKAMNARRKDE